MSGPHALMSSGGELDASNARPNTSSTATGAEQRRFWLACLVASVLQAASLRDFLGTGYKPFEPTLLPKLSLRRRLVHVPLQPDKLHVNVRRLDVVPPLRLQKRDDDALQRDRFDKTRS